VASADAQSVYFDDSGADVMVLGNDSYYEVAFSKTNGAIVGITDKATLTQVSPGSLDSSLWAIESHDQWSYASEYSAAGPSVFSYTWAAAAQTLTLTYAADPISNSHPLTVVVVVSPSDGASLDMSIAVTNEDEREVGLISFPHRLALDLGADDAVLLPVGYPGMLLEADFFASGDGPEPYDNYNGLWHADWVGIHRDGADLSMYALRDGLPLIGTKLGLRRSQGSSEHNFSYDHAYRVWLAETETFSGPDTRFLFGRSFEESLQAYREENGIDQFPSLAEKLGDRFSDFAAAPLLCHGFGEASNVFQYEDVADLADAFPNPSLMMLSWYWEGDFEGNHPDYVPPNPTWGTTDDFVQMVADIKAQGKLPMLFTLPIWWNENSREITELPPASLEDIAVIDIEGHPSYTNWGPNWGYNVSLCSAYTVQRIEQIFSDVFDTYGADVIYEDVVGAVPSMLDFNANCADETMYGQNIIEHLEQHSDVTIVVELGFDRLAETVIGFMGTLLDKENMPPRSPFGPMDGWRPYPTAPMLYHDKIIPYPYWSSAPTAYEISFNLHFGIPLTEWIYVPTTPSIPLIRDFQQRILARIIGKRMTDYEDLAQSVSQSTFEDISVIWNRSYLTEYDTGVHTLPPMGSLVTSASGDLVGGILTRFNGVELSTGDHYLVVEFSEDLVTVRHPLGTDSPISITIPTNWIDVSSIGVDAVLQAGRTPIEHTLSAGNVVFTMERLVNSALVDRFEIIYGVVFRDGFESGDTSAWSSEVGGLP
jgi:hypothetical protein